MLSTTTRSSKVSDSIAMLMRATALYAELLNGGAEIPAIHDWRARCNALVGTLRQAMQDAQYPAAHIDEVSLAQSALLDELTLRALPPAQQGEWSRESLQMRFHGVRDGASRVWERIDALLDNSRPDRAALELYGILLGLGFSGARADADACRRRVKLAVTRLACRDGAAPVPATSLFACRRARVDCNDEVTSPDTAHELPVILVAGPYAAAAFEDGGRTSTLRRTGDAVWMLVRTPGELAASIATIKDSHQRLPDAVLMPVVPDGDRDDAFIRQEFSRWRYELDQTVGQRAAVLPCYIAIYACLGANNDAAAAPIWFRDAMDLSTIQPEISHARHAVSLIRRQLDQAWLAITQPALATRAALGHAVFDWLEDTALLSILSSLANTAPLSLRGLLLSDIGYSPTHAGAWTRWLTGKTGLRLRPVSPKRQPLPLPGIIARPALCQTAKRGAQRPGWPTSHVVAASVAVVVASISVSAWMNSGPAALVASELKHVVSKSDQPKGVTIDNLSLFDSGKTALKPGAEPKLKVALDLILANPDKRILIAGHTDDVGTSAANLALSEARARAIRDWFVDTASLPVTRFAIQGYGDTRPVASNEDSLGREMNRRVEITLVPDSRAD